MGGIEKIFSKTLKVRLKNADSIEKCFSMKIDVEIHEIITPVHRREIAIKLTDDNNLFFLYMLVLGDDDFQILKTQQGLLVDFVSFPKKFIGLLELCLNEEKKENARFILELQIFTTTATLCITETNEFKHLTHLSLKFLPATETQLNKHLAKLAGTFREQFEITKDHLETISTKLEKENKDISENLSKKMMELEKLQNEWSLKSAQLFSQKSEELSIEREKSLNAQVAIQQKFEKEKKELEQVHVNIVKELECKIQNQQTSLQDQKSKLIDSEHHYKELDQQHGRLKTECEKLNNDLNLLRINNSSLSDNKTETDQIISNLQSSLKSKETELTIKNDSLNKLTNEYKILNDKLNKTVDENELKNKQNLKLETNVKTLSSEMIKANEIIKKLQNEVKSYHSKLKLRTQVSTEQEKLLSEKGRQLDESRKEQENLKAQLEKNVDHLNKLQNSVENLEEKLAKSNEINKTNENVIQWLNKQITDMQLGKTNFPISLDFSSSTVNSTTHRPNSSQINSILTMSVPTETVKQNVSNFHPSNIENLNRNSNIVTKPHYSESLTSRIATSNAGSMGLDSKYLQKTNRPPLASAYFPVTK